jgi:hypothetical protein
MAFLQSHGHTPRCYVLRAGWRWRFMPGRRIKRFIGWRIKFASIHRLACLFTYLSLLYQKTTTAAAAAVVNCLTLTLQSCKQMISNIKFWFSAFRTQENIAVMCCSRFQWSCCLECGPTAVRLLGLWVRILPGAWMSVSCECCVLSGTGLCVGLVTRAEESYRVWCVWVWSSSLDEEDLAH